MKLDKIDFDKYLIRKNPLKNTTVRQRGSITISLGVEFGNLIADLSEEEGRSISDTIKLLLIEALKNRQNK